MKILITGANGFIGSHVFSSFLQKNNNVIGWGRKNHYLVNRVNLEDYEAVCEALAQYLPELIIHCAGIADVGRSMQDPQNDYVGNVTTTRNLLFAVKDVQNCSPRIVFLSSAGVYGTPTSLPIGEETELRPMSPYALHKVMCEEMCQYFSDNYGMDIKILRIFSAYGEGIKKQLFWDMHKKLKATGKLELFGTGKESRDFIHIDDVVHAIECVVNNAPKEEKIYNIANGEEITILRAAESFARATGLEHDNIIFSGIKKAGDPINWKADVNKIKALGYQQSVSFEEGVRRYVQWAEGQE